MRLSLIVLALIAVVDCGGSSSAPTPAPTIQPITIPCDIVGTLPCQIPPPATPAPTPTPSAPTSFALSGTVRDAFSGGVLPNISVALSTGASTTTNNTGRYVFAQVSTGATRVTASASGYVTQTQTVTVSADSTVDLLLERTPTSSPTPGPTPGPSPTPTPTPTPTPSPTPSPTPAPAAPTITLLVARFAFPGDVLAFDGSGTTGAGVNAWVWDFGDGSATTTAAHTTTHTYAAVGTYAAAVSVTDTLGRTARSGATIVVSAPPPPQPYYTIAMTATPSTVVAGGTSVLTATVTQVNGAPAVTAWAWDCDGNSTTDFITANTATCTYNTVGTMVSWVRVTGGTLNATQTVAVTVTPQPPIFVNVSPSSFAPGVGVPVLFTATVSGASVPALMDWKWDDDNNGTVDHNDPSVASPNTRTTSYPSSGVKTMKVTVTEVATGRTASGQVTVTVP